MNSTMNSTSKLDIQKIQRQFDEDHRLAIKGANEQEIKDILNAFDALGWKWMDGKPLSDPCELELVIKRLKTSQAVYITTYMTGVVRGTCTPTIYQEYKEFAVEDAVTPVTPTTPSKPLPPIMQKVIDANLRLVITMPNKCKLYEVLEWLETNTDVMWSSGAKPTEAHSAIAELERYLDKGSIVTVQYCQVIGGNYGLTYDCEYRTRNEHIIISAAGFLDGQKPAAIATKGTDKTMDNNIIKKLNIQKIKSIVDDKGEITIKATCEQEVKEILNAFDALGWTWRCGQAMSDKRELDITIERLKEEQVIYLRKYCNGIVRGGHDGIVEQQTQYFEYAELVENIDAKPTTQDNLVLMQGIRDSHQRLVITMPTKDDLHAVLGWFQDNTDVLWASKDKPLEVAGVIEELERHLDKGHNAVVLYSNIGSDYGLTYDCVYRTRSSDVIVSAPEFLGDYARLVKPAAPIKPALPYYIQKAQDEHKRLVIAIHTKNELHAVLEWLEDNTDIVWAMNQKPTEATAAIRDLERALEQHSVVISYSGFDDEYSLTYDTNYTINDNHIVIGALDLMGNQEAEYDYDCDEMEDNDAVGTEIPPFKVSLDDVVRFAGSDKVFITVKNAFESTQWTRIMRCNNWKGAGDNGDNYCNFVIDGACVYMTGAMVMPESFVEISADKIEAHFKSVGAVEATLIAVEKVVLNMPAKPLAQTIGELRQCMSAMMDCMEKLCEHLEKLDQ